MNEGDRIRDRYSRRDAELDTARANPLNWYKLMELQERERAFVSAMRHAQLTPLADRTILDVGCGDGENLIQFLRLGCEPEALNGIDLLETAAEAARRRLPAGATIHVGDATTTDVAGPFDIVLQSTVFSSILNDTFQATLASTMWRLAKSGGGVLWHDFTYNNPRNPDVRGVPVPTVRKLFPEAAAIKTWRIMVAPPIGRRLASNSPLAYTLLDLIRPLRTHIVCWIQKTPTGR